MVTLYLIIGCALSLFAAYTKEKNNLPVPEEFQDTVGQIVLYGTLTLAWPFLVLYIVRHAKNNS